MTKLEQVVDPRALIGEGGWDAVVVVAAGVAGIAHASLSGPLERARAIDEKLGASPSVLPVEGVAGGRLVIADAGELTREHDDVRSFADTARRAVTRARDAGAKAPLLLLANVPADEAFAHAAPVAALAALGGLWQPLEAGTSRGPSLERLGVATLIDGELVPLDPELCRWVSAVEAGKNIARDLCGTEPERMAAIGFAKYCEEAFAGLPIEVTVVSEQSSIAAGYPLLAAVARASMTVARHHPRVIRLVYEPEGQVDRTLLFAGKGVTYDTGGADIKAGGAMAGMSRDKGGAAAVAGLMHAVATLRPNGVRVVAELGVVRNSVGADAFVTDEIITSHAGVRVRIGNTDAEGRLVLADLLSHLRAEAVEAVAPQLFSVATLTGHAHRAVGPYSIAIDNRPARAAGVAARLADEGDRWGDPFEVSRLRREDWEFVRPRTNADDVLSCNNGPSSTTSRGHQFPMAFLAVASGIAPHCHRDAELPLAFTHIDIGGSGVEDGDWQHGAPTAAPIVALMRALLQPQK